MLFFPLPGTYAVVEIDVEKTLQSLDDPLANAAGAKIKTTQCIVYLDFILQLPFPDDPTFKYMAYIIGPGMRPENTELCITPDMCIPIFPNTEHPSADREPLRPDPPFPFSNCYHWFGPEMWLDLRIANDHRDYSLEGHTELPGDQHVKMVSIQGRDVWRSICNQKERDGGSGTGGGDALHAMDTAQHKSDTPSPIQVQPSLLPRSPTPPIVLPATAAPLEADDPPIPAAESQLVDDGDRRQRCDCCGAYGECYSVDGSENGGSDSPNASIYQSSEGSNESTEALDELDVFGLDGDERDDYLPIVKIWLDIGAHFTEEGVPDPMEFMRQRDELVKIIEESKARARAARETADSVAATAESSSVVEDAPVQDLRKDGTIPSMAAEANTESASANGTEGVRRPAGLLTKLADASASLLRIF